MTHSITTDTTTGWKSITPTNDLASGSPAKMANDNTLALIGLVSTGGALQRDLNANSHKVTNLATPTSSGDATPKTYVDTAVGAIDLSDLVPYTGASRAIDLNGQDLSNVNTASFAAGAIVLESNGGAQLAYGTAHAGNDYTVVIQPAATEATNEHLIEIGGDGSQTWCDVNNQTNDYLQITANQIASGGMVLQLTQGGSTVTQINGDGSAGFSGTLTSNIVQLNSHASISPTAVGQIIFDPNTSTYYVSGNGVLVTADTGFGHTPWYKYCGIYAPRPSQYNPPDGLDYWSVGIPGVSARIQGYGGGNWKLNDYTTPDTPFTVTDNSGTCDNPTDNTDPSGSNNFVLTGVPGQPNPGYSYYIFSLNSLGWIPLLSFAGVT